MDRNMGSGPASKIAQMAIQSPQERGVLQAQLATLCILQANKQLLTVQISALFLPERCADFLHPRCESYLYISRHLFIPFTQSPLRLGFLDHFLNSLDSILAITKPAGYLLRQLFNILLLSFLDIVIVEARENMLLVKLVQLCRLQSNILQYISNFVLNIHPSWRKQIHFDYCVSIVLECSG